MTSDEPFGKKTFEVYKAPVMNHSEEEPNLWLAFCLFYEYTLLDGLCNATHTNMCHRSKSSH